MAQVFLSYASQDRERAKAFAEILESQGWTVFWDRSIPPGRVFDDVISEALDLAKCVVVLWSRAAVQSNWVKEEATVGAARGILVPALIDDVSPPLGFRRLQAARLVGWPAGHDVHEFSQVIASVAGLLGKDASDAPARPPQAATMTPVNQPASVVGRSSVSPASRANRAWVVAAVVFAFGGGYSAFGVHDTTATWALQPPYPYGSLAR